MTRIVIWSIFTVFIIVNLIGFILANNIPYAIANFVLLLIYVHDLAKDIADYQDKKNK